MRKQITVLLLVALFAMLIPLRLPGARAADRVEMRVSIPADTELSDTGTVDWIKFTLHNLTNEEITLLEPVLSSVLFSSPRAVETLTIAPGSVREFSVTSVTIPGSLLSKPIAFALDWKEGPLSVPYSIGADLTIPRSVEPVLTLSSSADKTLCRVGDPFTVTYTLKNDTIYDMELLYLEDSGVRAGAIALPKTDLKAGETLRVPLTDIMGEADLLSKPQVTYLVRNHRATVEASETLRIEAVLVSLLVEIEAFPPTPDGTVFRIRVANAGSKPMTDIRLVDEINTPVTEAFSLEPAESRNFSFTVVPPGDTARMVRFMLTAKDCFNQIYSYTHPDSFEAKPYIAGEQVNLSCDVTVVELRTEGNGDIIGVFEFELRNYSDVEMRSAQVLELYAYTEEPVFLAEVLNRGVQSFRREFRLNDIARLSFCLRAKDATDQEHATSPVEFDVPMLIALHAQEQSTPVPTGPGEGTVLFAGLQEFLRIAAIVLVVLCAVGAIIALALRGVEQKLLNHIRKHEPQPTESKPVFDLDAAEEERADAAPALAASAAHTPATPAKFRYVQAQDGQQVQRLPEGAVAVAEAELPPALPEATDTLPESADAPENIAKTAAAAVDHTKPGIRPVRAEVRVTPAAPDATEARFLPEAPRTLPPRRVPRTQPLVWNETLRVAVAAWNVNTES
ncbi:MAG: hypothetical protein FWF10_03100 [Clostridiales bacterium]|nr:hypothetical protein [Clostridiales bacterium]